MNGQAITYTAVAGTLTVGGTNAQDAMLGLDGKWLAEADVKTDKPDDAPATARIFYAAYFKKGAASETRPITFLYNGGPGSSTMWLHMGSFGPRRVVTADTVHEAAAPYKIINNENSLLDVSDLVFIDAPGTGFSRIFGKNKEDAFWGLDPDAHAFERFIRRFLTKYNRWRFAYAISLWRKLRNTAQRGVELGPSKCGPERHHSAFGNPQLRQFGGRTLRKIPASIRPMRWLCQRMPQALGITKRSPIRQRRSSPFSPRWSSMLWANTCPRCCKGRSCPKPNARPLLKKLHDYTGLAGRVPVEERSARFRRTHSQRRSRKIRESPTGRLDTRYQGPDYDPLSSDAEYDPQSNAISSAYTTAINQYMLTDLHFGENWTYKPSAYGEPGFRWPFRHTEGGPNVMPDLAQTLKANPKTKVLLAGGYYDLATPFFEGMYEMHHLPIPHNLQANISYHYYQAGHMIYVNDSILKQFHDDVAAFIKGTEAAK